MKKIDAYIKYHSARGNSGGDVRKLIEATEELVADLYEIRFGDRSFADGRIESIRKMVTGKSFDEVDVTAKALFLSIGRLTSALSDGVEKPDASFEKALDVEMEKAIKDVIEMEKRSRPEAFLKIIERIREKIKEKEAERERKKSRSSMPGD